MSGDLVVPIESNVTLTATASIQHMCPFRHEVDNGSVTITWDTQGWTLELPEVRAYLRTFSDREISPEDLPDEIRLDLGSHFGIENVAVQSNWRTAGMEVRCVTSPIRAGRQ
jgi:NADPH-dependent 7-cyano-7-deazaguanine reductase QueF